MRMGSCSEWIAAHDSKPWINADRPSLHRLIKEGPELLGPPPSSPSTSAVRTRARVWGSRIGQINAYMGFDTGDFEPTRLRLGGWWRFRWEGQNGRAPIGGEVLKSDA